MIFLQILAVLILLSLTIVQPIIFNLYLINWIYLIGMIFFGAVYALLYGLVFLDFKVAVCVFMIWLALYVLRITYLGIRLYAKENKEYFPVIKGSFSNKKPNFSTVFYFPLSFLKIINFIPGFNKVTVKINGLEIEVKKTIELLLQGSRGANVGVSNEHVNLHLEIY